MMWRSNACKPWLLAFLPPLLSLDMDLQVKHVEFDTRPCAMISAWCASPWQVSLADLTLNHGAWKKTLSWSLVLSVWAIDWCVALRFCSVWVRDMSKRTHRETWSASKISSKNNMCSHSSMSARSLCPIPVKHKQHYSHSLQYKVYINVWICAPYRASRIQTWRFCNCILQYPTVSWSVQELFYLPLFDSCSSIAATRAILGMSVAPQMFQLCLTFLQTSIPSRNSKVSVPHCWSLVCHNLLPFIPSFVSNLKLEVFWSYPPTKFM